jgi:hypothetical protein
MMLLSTGVRTSGPLLVVESVLHSQYASFQQQHGSEGFMKPHKKYCKCGSALGLFCSFCHFIETHLEEEHMQVDDATPPSR